MEEVDIVGSQRQRTHRSLRHRRMSDQALAAPLLASAVLALLCCLVEARLLGQVLLHLLPHPCLGVCHYCALPLHLEAALRCLVAELQLPL